MIRRAYRSLIRRPGYSLAVILILALGIGANTAIFSAVRSVILAPLPFPESDRLIRIVGTIDVGGEPQQTGVFPRHFEELRARSGTLLAVTAQRFRNLTLSGDGDPERVVGIGVTESWAETIGVQPILGRTFDAGEYAQGSEASVAVISHALWQRRFDGAPEAVGRTLLLNGRAFGVIGIMPRQFNFPYGSDLWLPLTIEPVAGAPGDLNVAARLKPRVAPQEAIAELEMLGGQISAEVPGDERRSLTARSFDEEFPRDPENSIAALFAAVGFVLLLVCVNVANLQLARSASRTRESAVRATLGATHARQVCELLTESLLLAMAAVALGFAMAMTIVDWLVLLVPPRLGEVIQTVQLDSGVLMFSAATGLVTALLFGLAPAWRLARVAPAALLKTGGYAASMGGRWMRPLVVAQVGLAFVLLSGAGLMAQSFARLINADVGYDPGGLYRIAIGLPEPRYDDPGLRARALGRVIEEVERLPGVESVGVTNLHPVPRTNTNAGARIILPGLSPDEELPIVNNRMVSPDYFQAVGIPLLRGRAFSLHDTARSEPVAAVSRKMAERLWPGQDPIGKQFRPAGAGQPSHTVTAVVGEIAEPNFAPLGTLYRPYAQATRFQSPGIWDTTSVALMVRALRATEAQTAAIREAVWQVDRSLTVFDAAAMTTVLREPLDGQKFGTIVFACFGAFAVLLATIGTYALIRLAVVQRNREFGIRLALGSRRGALQWLVLRDGLFLIGGGLTAGALATVALAPLAQSFAEVGTGRITVAVCVLLTLLLAGWIACWLPARRAARIDPMSALREE